MFYTVYQVTNIRNGKVYIGCHQTTDCNDHYIGSGHALKQAIDKYGRESFVKEVLHVFDNSADMFLKEAEIVCDDFVNDPLTYNQKVGGRGGWSHINNVDGDKLSDTARREKYGDDWRNVICDLGRERLRELYGDDWHDYLRQRIREKYPNGVWYGRKHTEESKRKIGNTNSKRQRGSGNSQYGTRWIHSPELKQSKRIAKTEPLPEGWQEGRKIKFK